MKLNKKGPINKLITYDDSESRSAVIKCRKDCFNQIYQNTDNILINRYLLLSGEYAIDLVCYQYDVPTFIEVERCSAESTKHYVDPTIDRDVNILAGDEYTLNKFEKYFMNGSIYDNKRTIMAFISMDSKNISFFYGSDICDFHKPKRYSTNAKKWLVSIEKKYGIFCKLDETTNTYKIIKNRD